MEKHKKIRESETANSGPSRLLVPAFPKRGTTALIVAVILCTTIAGFSAIRPSSATDGKGRETGTPPDSALTPEQQAAALKKDEMELAEGLLEDFPKKADAFVLMGNVWARHGNAAEGLKFFRKGLELDPNRPDVYRSMGRFAMEQGQYEEAIACWRKVLEMDPQMPDVHNNIALALMGLGKQEEANEELEKDIQISPRSSLSYFLLGQGYLQQKDYEKARVNYEKAITIEPSYTNAYYGLFTVHARLKQRHKAEQYMAIFKRLKAEDMKVLRDRNDSWDDLANIRRGAAATYMNAGQVYRTEGDLQTAGLLLKKAVELDPENTLSLMRLASLYQATNRGREALQLYKGVSRIEPQNAFCHWNIGIISAKLKQYADAEEAFGRVIKLAPEGSAAYRALAQLYLETNRRFPEARELAEKAVALEGSAANYFALSWACDKNGDTAGAFSAIKRAVELDPANARYKRIYELMQKRN